MLFTNYHSYFTYLASHDAGFSCKLDSEFPFATSLGEIAETKAKQSANKIDNLSSVFIIVLFVCVLSSVKIALW